MFKPPHPPFCTIELGNHFLFNNFFPGFLEPFFYRSHFSLKIPIFFSHLLWTPQQRYVMWKIVLKNYILYENHQVSGIFLADSVHIDNCFTAAFIVSWLILSKPTLCIVDVCFVSLPFLCFICFQFSIKLHIHPTSTLVRENYSVVNLCIECHLPVWWFDCDIKVYNISVVVYNVHA